MPNITCACILVVILPRRPTTLASFPRAAWHSSSHHQDTVSMWRGIPHVWLRFESVQAVWLRHSIYTSSKIGGHTADIMLECDYFGDIFSQLPPRVCPANLAFTEGSFPSLLTATVIQTLVEFQGHCWVPVSCNEVFANLIFLARMGMSYWHRPCVFIYLVHIRTVLLLILKILYITLTSNASSHW